MKNLEFIDKDGKTREVTNLNEAIKQAIKFMDYQLIGKGNEVLNAKNHAYWADVHYKLLKLKHEKNRKPIEVEDFNGNALNVTDLENALRIVEEYKDYYLNGKDFSTSTTLKKEYWMHLHKRFSHIKGLKK